MPGASDPRARRVLLSSLDYLGCGFICREDLEWLDKWDPPDWLAKDPDNDAKEELYQLMISVYERPLRAWRNLLDLNNSNHVSWGEFTKACDILNFNGNRGGAWRALDIDLSGAISMDEFDRPGAHLLSSFKEWAEKHFGSVALAFKTLDPTGPGVLTYQDLKRTCHKLRWDGDVRTLFEALDCDDNDDSGKRTVSLKDVGFLDTWEDDLSAEQQAEEDIVKMALRKQTVVRSECLDMHTFKQLDSNAKDDKHQNLDGHYKHNRRKGILVKSDSVAGALKANSSGAGSKNKIGSEEDQPTTGFEGLFATPSSSITFLGGRSGSNSRASTAPSNVSCGSLYGTAPLQHLRQPKTLVERMTHLNLAKPRSGSKPKRHPVLGHGEELRNSHRKRAVY